MTVKVYKNVSDEDLVVIGVGEIPAGEQVSLSGEHLPPVVLENYPGLVDLTDPEEKNKNG